MNKENRKLKGVALIKESNRSLNDNAASLVERATGICMEVWFSLTHTFHAQADKYDPELVNPNDKFMFFKLAPGGDSRDDAYKRIIDACESLCDKLNDALGRGGLFTPEIVRKDGMLEVRARYGEGSGGIFHAKTKQQDVGIAIIMTMPRQGVIRDAFKALITTPAFPIGDEIPDPESVIPDKPVDSNQGQPQSTNDKLSALGGVNIVGNTPVRKESIMNYKSTLSEAKAPSPGYQGPPQPGYYIVYGDAGIHFQQYADWVWKATFPNGIELPGTRYNTPQEANQAKELFLASIRKKNAQTGRSAPFKGDWQFHVKRWDGQRWHQISVSIPNLIPDIKIPDLDPTIAPVDATGGPSKAPAPVVPSDPENTSQHGYSYGYSIGKHDKTVGRNYDEDQVDHLEKSDEYKEGFKDGYNDGWRGKPQRQTQVVAPTGRRGVRTQSYEPTGNELNEELAANSTGGYQVGGGKSGNEVTADAGYKKSMSMRRRKQAEAVIDQWSQYATGISLSGGPFGK